MRVIYAGTPEFALPPLQALLDENLDIVAVLTQPDRPAGRGKHLRASPVKQLALEHGLTVMQPESLKDTACREQLMALQPDLLIVVAYGLMIPDWLLALPPLGCWNIHASLLPRWRGAAPIQRAIEAGDTQTGVCIMQMEASLDTGPVYHRLETPIGLLENGGDLHDRLAGMGAQALKQCIELVMNNALPQARAQDDSQAIYARKLSKAEAELDWNQTAGSLQRKIRAFNPWPVAWCELGGQRLRIWQAEVVGDRTDGKPGLVSANRQSLVVGTSDKSLKILEIQRAGGQRMSTEKFLNAGKPLAL